MLSPDQIKISNAAPVGNQVLYPLSISDGIHPLLANSIWPLDLRGRDHLDQ